MRQIEIYLHCDREGCPERTPEIDDSPEAVTEMTVAIDGAKPRKFQVCPKHRAELNDILVPLMQAGVTVDVPAKKSGGNAAATAAASQGAYDCQVTGCGRTLKGRAGMAQHVIRSHGFADLAAYEATYHTHID